MVQIEKYDPFENDIWFYCNEGNYTVETSAENEKYPKFSSQLEVGDYVKLDTSTDKTVAKAGDGDTIIGQVISNPIFDGSRPQVTASSGNYHMRICTVRLFGYYVHNVKLKAENTAVAVGDAVEYVGDNEFDKASSGSTVALASASALSGKKIPVLMGLLGF